MILSQVDLREAVATREIEFDPPLDDRQWGEASIDLRLGCTFTKIQKAEGLIVSVADGLGSIGKTKLWDTIEIDLTAGFG
jgi:deoxycytidine triphosphate deaminase